MKLRAETGIFSSNLENWCALLGCIQLIALVVAGMLSPALLAIIEYKCVFVTSISMSIVLLVAAIFRVRWMLLCWVTYASLLIIGIPYSVVTFAGFFRVMYSKLVYDSFATFVIEYIGFSAIFVYIIRTVLSFFMQLLDEEEQQNVEVTPQ